MSDSPAIPTWFDTPAKVAALRAEAASWKNTPFFANSEAKGRTGGVDCVHLLHGIYRALGVIAAIEIPPSPMDWGQHQTRSLLIEAFETWPALTARFRRLPANKDFLAGDTLCFDAGKVPHHGGILVGPKDTFIHAFGRPGVHLVQLGAEFRGWRIVGELAAVFRPIP